MAQLVVVGDMRAFAKCGHILYADYVCVVIRAHVVNLRAVVHITGKFPYQPSSAALGDILRQPGHKYANMYEAVVWMY